MKKKPKLGVGMRVHFRSDVHEKDGPYYPLFEPYKGHTFEIVGFPYDGHVELKCVTRNGRITTENELVVVDGYVHVDELKMV